MENLEQRIDQVRNDREHGSRWLVHQAISIMQDLAKAPASSEDEHLQQLRHAGQELIHARPAMAAIAGAVTRILNAPAGSAGMAQEAALLEDRLGIEEMFFVLADTVAKALPTCDRERWLAERGCSDALRERVERRVFRRLHMCRTYWRNGRQHRQVLREVIHDQRYRK